jgi:hypothetical protein
LRAPTECAPSQAPGVTCCYMGNYSNSEDDALKGVDIVVQEKGNVVLRR